MGEEDGGGGLTTGGGLGIGDSSIDDETVPCKNKRTASTMSAGDDFKTPEALREAMKAFVAKCGTQLSFVDEHYNEPNVFEPVNEGTAPWDPIEDAYKISNSRQRRLTLASDDEWERIKASGRDALWSWLDRQKGTYTNLVNIRVRLELERAWTGWFNKDRDTIILLQLQRMDDHRQLLDLSSERISAALKTLRAGST